MLLSQAVFMDFEASALRHGYPVEVGWASVEGTGIQAQSLLIKPSDEWLTPEFTWDPVAESLHGLSLAHIHGAGRAPASVCHELNRQLHDKIILFDTGPDGADRRWMDLLFAEGGQVRAFKLGGPAGEVLQALAAEYGIDDALQSRIKAAAPPINHRAAQDAAHYAWRAVVMHRIAKSAEVDAAEEMAKIVVGGVIRR